MARADRTGNRKPRDSFKKRAPDLGYYFIVTDTNETEENYMYGLRDSLPKELQGRIVIKVSKAKTDEMVTACKEQGYAEYYSADLSEKVIRGRKENALKCKFNGGTLPIGYVIDEEQHFQIDPLTAPFVLDVFKKYDKGATMKELRDWLNDSGVRNTRGQPLNFNSIQHMLSNRRYIGEYKYRDIIVPDGIPAIVPEDLFDRVQEKLAQNRKAPARHKAEDDYLLTTKLFCGYCGAYLCGESGKSRNGTIHHYYKCVSVKKKRTDCKKKPVRKQWLEDLVVNEVMKVVMDDKAIEAIVSMVMDLQDRENTNGMGTAHEQHPHQS